ncbi:hypothetical protein DFH07DRAFT_972533 [Mycena maculata]|uniref:Phosphatidate phosphatase APP1 catalytic domain-containing protein n=1 Tax=Mycena maculata TaxID=230809 RepID=A0AAD7HGZ8_9AGAR|nr:hypothetical protein DFH07DRAFT_972533 [Mycena maculata]
MLWTHTGNATAYLVPTEELTIISDIDDILRSRKIYEPAQGPLNSFTRPWMDMPDIHANWSKSLPDMHFHYYDHTRADNELYVVHLRDLPLGSFDTRPLNSATFQSFPECKFVLIADTSNSDVMNDYPAMVTD